MLDQAAWRGCGISMLRLFKACNSQEPSCNGLTQPGFWPWMLQLEKLWTQAWVGSGLCLGRAGEGRSPEAMGVGCQLRELPPCQLPPSLGCTAHQPLPPGRCLLLPVPRASTQTGLFQQEVQCDLTYFLNYFFFSSGLFMKLEQSIIYDFSPHKSINALSHKRALRADHSGHVDNNN